MSDDSTGLVKQICYQVKAQGLFDQFRKHYLKEVESTEEFASLRSRITDLCNSKLNEKEFKSHLKKNECKADLKEMFDGHKFVDREIDRILGLVLKNEKMDPVFLPEVEKVTAKFLGIPAAPEVFMPPVPEPAPHINCIASEEMKLSEGTDEMELDTDNEDKQQVQEELAEYNPNDGVRRDDSASNLLQLQQECGPQIAPTPHLKPSTSENPLYNCVPNIAVCENETSMSNVVNPEDSVSQIGRNMVVEEEDSEPAEDDDSEHAVSGSPIELTQYQQNNDQIEMDLESSDSEQQHNIIIDVQRSGNNLPQPPSPIPSPPRPSILVAKTHETENKVESSRDECHDKCRITPPDERNKYSRHRSDRKSEELTNSRSHSRSQRRESPESRSRKDSRTSGIQESLSKGSEIRSSHSKEPVRGEFQDRNIASHNSERDSISKKSDPRAKGNHVESRDKRESGLKDASHSRKRQSRSESSQDKQKDYRKRYSNEGEEQSGSRVRPKDAQELPKSSRRKDSLDKSSHAKQSDGRKKDSHRKDSRRKESISRDSHAKESHAKESHAKDSPGSSSKDLVSRVQHCDESPSPSSQWQATRRSTRERKEKCPYDI